MPMFSRSMASVKWSDDALRDLEKIDSLITMRVLEKVTWFEKNFATVVPENLHGRFKGLYKLRVGDFRVIYSTHNNLITVEGVRHRRDVYR